MEGDGKTRAAPPYRDNNGKGTKKTTSVREQVGKKEGEKSENIVKNRGARCGRRLRAMPAVVSAG
jgi:hypothetical protein